MSPLLRREIGTPPLFIDARAEAPGTPGAAEVWYQALARGEGPGRWIAPLPASGEPPEGASAVSLGAPGMRIGPAARALPLHVPRLALAPPASAHPGPIVIAHLSAYPCAAENLLVALDAMDGDGRLVLETSGASIAGFVGIAARRHPGRVVFGSGAPRFDPVAQIGHVIAALPDDALLAAVLHGNAARLLGPA